MCKVLQPRAYQNRWGFQETRKDEMAMACAVDHVLLHVTTVGHMISHTDAASMLNTYI